MTHETESEEVVELSGFSFIAGRRGSGRAETFAARNAQTGAAVEPLFTSCSVEELDAAAFAAVEAFGSYGTSTAAHRAGLLRAIAAGLEANAAQLVSRAMLETGLPEARLQGEVGRTCGQLRLFASVVEEGSWQNVRIDTALPDRKPQPRPDLRSMLFPVGPVAVFGASNFPLAFSVAGGDTASALAAGNPVIVKAHSAHPGTSEIVAAVITEAMAASGMHPGVFSMLYDKGIAIGQALVKHPAIQSVAFTGSKRGGRALMNLVAARESPIPCFTEMSSVNPVFLLPGVLGGDPRPVAKGLHGSFTLGAGQFCTKPGLAFLPESGGADAFREELNSLTGSCGSFTMLTPEIADAFHRGIAERQALGVESTTASNSATRQTHAVLFQTGIETFRRNTLLQEEIFGPSTLLVNWSDRDELLAAAESLEGHLTATILGTEADLADYADLIAVLERKVGRLLLVHGGPYPATSDSRFTSVGSQAILRFVRPRCYQNFPQAALPEALRDENSPGIWRLVDGALTRGPVVRR